MLQQIKSVIHCKIPLNPSFTKYGQQTHFLQRRCKYIKHSNKLKLLKPSNYRNSIVRRFGNDHFNPFIERLKLSVKKIRSSYYHGEIEENKVSLGMRMEFMPFDENDTSKTLQEKEEEIANKLATVMDLSRPHLWFPLARSMKRKFILHVGPTNSGKTHSALERLKKAKSGVYCGPLRLLAEEIFERLNNNNVRCNLVTGQKIVLMDAMNENDVDDEPEVSVPDIGLKDIESLFDEDTDEIVFNNTNDDEAIEETNFWEGYTHRSSVKHVSCTIEMADLRTPVECALIDEYQMLADRDRGWAWTNAILGIPAKEVHLCGDMSSIDLVKKLLSHTNDEIEIREYKRLSPLKIENKPIRKENLIRELRDGDALIVFSKKNLYSYKRAIEKAGKKCCVIYGNLPPENRTQQSKLFNDENSGRNILVATDAVGMGLNLNIRRIIFSETVKFDGRERRDLTPSEIKQIGGRAGRFRSRFPEGKIASTSYESIAAIKRAFMTNTINRKSGLLPLAEHIEIFEAIAPNVSLSVVLNSFAQASIVSENYFLCNLDDMKTLAESIDHLNLSLREKYTFSSAPCSTNEPLVLEYFTEFCTQYATGQNVMMPSESEVLLKNRTSISMLEIMYKIADLYLWLSYRFESFVDRERANEIKSSIEKKIGAELEKVPVTPKTRYKDKFDFEEIYRQAEKVIKKTKKKKLSRRKLRY